MEQYVCHNVKEVMKAIYELTRTRSMAKTPQEKKEEFYYWRGVCEGVKAKAEREGWDWTCISDFSAFDQKGQEIEVEVDVGYEDCDNEDSCWLVWID